MKWLFRGKFNLFQGNYDLTKLLDADSKPGFCLVRKKNKQNFINKLILQRFYAIEFKVKGIFTARSPN